MPIASICSCTPSRSNNARFNGKSDSPMWNRGCLSFSITTTRRPRLANRAAAVDPAGPPPMINTSQLFPNAGVCGTGMSPLHLIEQSQSVGDIPFEEFDPFIVIPMNVFYAVFLIIEKIRARNILNIDVFLIERDANFCGVRTHKKFGLNDTVFFPLDCPFPCNQSTFDCPRNILHFYCGWHADCCIVDG